MIDSKKDYIFAVGRRREAVARVRLHSVIKDSLLVAGEKVKKGDIFVNDLKAEVYFGSLIAKVKLEEPLKTASALDKYVFTIKTAGGGKNGQLDAVIHGISRALSLVDEKNRKLLKKKGFLTRDPRARQRRKVGMGGKSRREKQSPKR